LNQEQTTFFESFYQEHFKELVAYAYRFLGNWDLAKDATQEAFLIGLKKIDQFYSCPNHIGWIKIVIRKTSSNINHTRKNHARIVIPLEAISSIPSVWDHYSGVDSIAVHCSEILSPEEYLLFEQIIINRESYVTMAKALHISEWACRKRIQRILKKLQRNWNNE